MTTYLAFPQQSICIRIKLGLNINKLQKVFPNGYNKFEAENNDEFFSKMLCNLRHNKRIEKYSFYEVTDTNGEIVFCYAGEQEDCEALQKRLGLGVILKSNITTASRQVYYASNVANMKSILKRLDKASDFADRFLLYDNVSKDNQVGYIPEKFKLIEAHNIVDDIIPYQPKTLQETDLVHTYEADPMFANMISSTRELLNSYNELVANVKNYEEIVHACDLRTLDILHDIEFNFTHMNACEGYKVIKKLYETRQYRRNAKDKIAVLSTVDEFFGETNIEKLLSMEEKLKNRQYRERVNTGIFDFEKAEHQATEEETQLKEDLEEKIS